MGDMSCRIGMGMGLLFGGGRVSYYISVYLMLALRFLERCEIPHLIS